MDFDVTTDKTDVLARACAALSSADPALAGQVLKAGYPFVAARKVVRRYTERQTMRIFFRDGFTDRYSGTRLVHPGALRLLSIVLPDEFPAHPNWSMGETHFAFWELFPSIDHLQPVSRGGADDATNWVTTSMLRNSAKAHWTLKELGWSLVPGGDLNEWDGLSAWYVEYLTDRSYLLDGQPYLQRWFSATVDTRAEC